MSISSVKGQGHGCPYVLALRVHGSFYQHNILRKVLWAHIQRKDNQIRLNKQIIYNFAARSAKNQTNIRKQRELFVFAILSWHVLVNDLLLWRSASTGLSNLSSRLQLAFLRLSYFLDTLARKAPSTVTTLLWLDSGVVSKFLNQF